MICLKMGNYQRMDVLGGNWYLRFSGLDLTMYNGPRIDVPEVQSTKSQIRLSCTWVPLLLGFKLMNQLSSKI